MKSSLNLLMTAALLVVATLSFADNETTRDPNVWEWGANPTEAKGKWMNLDRTFQGELWAEAAAPTNWLLQNAPDLHITLYIRAEKIYKNLIKAEKDKTHLNVLHDSLLTIYDLRIEHFGERAEILDKKGKKAYLYWYKDKSKHDELYALYKEVVELNGEKTSHRNLVYYFKSAAKQKKAGKMEETALLNLYDELSSMITKNLATADAKHKEKLAKDQEDLDETLGKNVTLDCEFVTNFYGPKYKQEKSLELAKKISDQMIKNKCVSNELFLTTTNHVLTEAPDYGRYKLLGKVYENMGKKDEAYDNFVKAIEIAPHDTVKAPLYLEMAKIKQSKGDKPGARADAQKALQADPSLSAAHVLIGNLYFNSFGSCQHGNTMEDRAVYIAAYNEYKKAGASSKMASCQKQFPSMEEIFSHNKNVGDSVTIKCWINQTVTLQKRD